MTVTELAMALIGSNVLSVVVTKWLSKPADRAGIVKLRSEAGEIELEGEIKVTKFYKEQLEELVNKYTTLENKFEERKLETDACEERNRKLEIKYNELQREFTLLKLIVNSQQKTG